MDLDALKKYFSDENNIKNDVIINKGETVVDGKYFIEASFATLKNNSGNKRFIPYYNRLVKYYNLVSKTN
jgi:hypothetical protein